MSSAAEEINDRDVGNSNHSGGRLAAYLGAHLSDLNSGPAMCCLGSEFFCRIQEEHHKSSEEVRIKLLVDVFFHEHQCGLTCARRRVAAFRGECREGITQRNNAHEWFKL